jgi:hypothetical protein
MTTGFIYAYADQPRKPTGDPAPKSIRDTFNYMRNWFKYRQQPQNFDMYIVDCLTQDHYSYISDMMKEMHSELNNDPVAEDS